jgi:hypothetical protein
MEYIDSKSQERFVTVMSSIVPCISQWVESRFDTRCFQTGQVGVEGFQNAID